MTARQGGQDQEAYGPADPGKSADLRLWPRRFRRGGGGGPAEVIPAEEVLDEFPALRAHALQIHLLDPGIPAEEKTPFEPVLVLDRNLPSPEVIYAPGAIDELPALPGHLAQPIRLLPRLPGQIDPPYDLVIFHAFLLFFLHNFPEFHPLLAGSEPGHDLPESFPKGPAQEIGEIPALADGDPQKPHASPAFFTVMGGEGGQDVGGELRPEFPGIKE